MDEFVNWYLAPWSRVNRAVFGLVTAAASVPGMLLSLAGFGGGGGFLSPLNAVLGGGGDSVVDPAALLTGLGATGQAQALHGVSGGVAPAASAVDGFPWAALVDNVLLALVPLTMMRLRDMGRGEQHGVMLFWTLLAMTYSGTLADLLGVLGLTMGTPGLLLDGVSFIMWMWLCLAKTRRRQQLEESPLLRATRGYDAPVAPPSDSQALETLRGPDPLAGSDPRRNNGRNDDEWR